ncbi:MAG: hypothetical protein ABI411_21415 [Tahibacter sp.]
MSPRPLSLELNPNARISMVDSESSPAFFVEAPVKGASLSSVRVSAENFPGAHAFLCAILIDGHKDAQIGEHDAAELRQIGLFATADAMPKAVAYRFPLRDPAHANTVQSPAGIDDLQSRPTHRPALRIPVEWSEHALQFEPHHRRSVWSPVLIATGAEPDGRSDNQRSEASQAATVLDGELTRRQFEREGFAILENLLPAEHVKELGEYFHALAAQGFLAFHDIRGTRRYIAHNHPVASFWHDQLNERVSQLAGQRTKPSYSFVSLYSTGGDLAWHTDRPPCEYTITLLLDYAPLPADGRSPWAFNVKGRDGTIHSLHQRRGDALILRGRELMHGRDMLPDGHRSASLLFHFVNEGYDEGME